VAGTRLKQIELHYNQQDIARDSRIPGIGRTHAVGDTGKEDGRAIRRAVCDWDRRRQCQWWW
jgi:hypothetical protein